MKITTAALAGALLIAATAAASAQGFSRESTVTGPAGNTIQRQGTVTPDGKGGWTRESTVTGPAGNTIQRQGQVTQDGQGGWARQGSVTGPAGNTATYQGGGSCSGGKCEFGSTRTTRGGGTFNRSGSFRRD